MTQQPYLTAPLNAASAERLAADGLELRLVQAADADAFTGWHQVVRRGFLEPESSVDNTRAAAERIAYRRMTGVYDPTSPRPEQPAGTIASWVSELAVPGGGTVPSFAISSVTVAPTHRRRGIARAMVEGELRVAAGLGLPLAMLTVSEAPLYGRYGFGAAAMATSLRLDVKRASWTGPVPPGRVDFVPRESAREVMPALHDAIRAASPGEIQIPAGHWDRMLGTTPEAKDADALRTIQYSDAAGEARGAAVYTVRENHDDFTRSTVTVHYLLAQTPDAYAALWRFFVELDLVGTVEAGELSVDEALLWMISDRRAATVTVRDHHYLRVLDVAAALEARRYGAEGTLALEVVDPLGLSGGRFVLQVDAEGRATVSSSASLPEGAVTVHLGTSELSAAYLGGVSLETLTAAGRVKTTDAAAAARIFSWPTPPRLSFWY